MIAFRLTQERAYVVPALRRTSDGATGVRWRRLRVIVLCAVLAHVLLALALLRVLSVKSVGMDGRAPEVVLTLLAPTSEAPQVQSSNAQQQSQTAQTAQTTQEQPALRAPNVVPQAQPMDRQVQTHSSDAAAVSSALSNPVSAVSTPVSAPTSSPASAPGASTASNAAACSALIAFNRRYSGVLLQNSTVTLHLTRDAQGAVTAVSLVKSSGNTGLDTFALGSAQRARFKTEQGCAGRGFNLPILFKAKT